MSGDHVKRVFFFFAEMLFFLSPGIREIFSYALSYDIFYLWTLTVRPTRFQRKRMSIHADVVDTSPRIFLERARRKSVLH